MRSDHIQLLLICFCQKVERIRVVENLLWCFSPLSTQYHDEGAIKFSCFLHVHLPSTLFDEIIGTLYFGEKNPQNSRVKWEYGHVNLIIQSTIIEWRKKGWFNYRRRQKFSKNWSKRQRTLRSCRWREWSRFPRTSVTTMEISCVEYMRI